MGKYYWTFRINPYWNFRHWASKRRYPQLHARQCSRCKPRYRHVRY